MSEKLNVMSEKLNGFPILITSCKKITREHDVRIEESVKTTEHIDKSRSKYNEYLIDKGDPYKYFNDFFSDYEKEFGIPYSEFIKADKRRGSKGDTNADTSRKVLYQYCLYIGNCNYRCPDKMAKRVLRLFITKILPLKYPNFIVVTASIHNDEYAISENGKRIESAVHAHIIGFYIAHALTKEERVIEKSFKNRTYAHAKSLVEASNGTWDKQIWKMQHNNELKKNTVARWGKAIEIGRGLQSSINSACKEMEFIPSKEEYDTYIITPPKLLWDSFMKDLHTICELLGIRTNYIKNEKRQHYPKKLYKVLKQADLRELYSRKKDKELQNAMAIVEFQEDFIENEQLKLEKEKINIKNEKEKIEQENKYLNQYKKSLSKKSNDLDKEIENFNKELKTLRKDQEIVKRDNIFFNEKIESLNRAIDQFNSEREESQRKPKYACIKDEPYFYTPEYTRGRSR